MATHNGNPGMAVSFPQFDHQDNTPEYDPERDRGTLLLDRDELNAIIDAIEQVDDEYNFCVGPNGRYHTHAENVVADIKGRQLLDRLYDLREGMG